MLSYSGLEKAVSQRAILRLLNNCKAEEWVKKEGAWCWTKLQEMAQLSIEELNEEIDNNANN